VEVGNQKVRRKIELKIFIETHNYLKGILV